MSLYGDDCYFFYYSSCNKGSACPYRHVPEARGIEVTCTLWKAGHCSRPSCRYRHMEITVDRSNIPCYWESQPTGCTKPHCPFKHYSEKAEAAPEPERCVVAPINKTVGKTLDRSTPSPGSQGHRSSPKIEPVVVNPFSDDSDEGSPHKKQQKSDELTQVDINTPKVISFRKTATDEVTNSANIHIKSLSEIRLEKQMMQIINDSLDSPLTEESDIEPYQVLERPPGPLRRIVMATHEEPETEAPIMTTRVVEPMIKTTSPVSPVKKGNVKSRLGRKIGVTEDDTECQVVPNKSKPKITSRLGYSTSNTAKENKDDLSEVEIKSLQEIRSAKLQRNLHKKTEEHAKKGHSLKKVIRRITVVEDDSHDNNRKQRALTTVKTDNDQECDQVDEKKKIQEKNRKRGLAQDKTVKQERAIYVPPGSKKSENTSVSPTKKSRLSRSPDKDGYDNNTQGKSEKFHVQTFAQLMAEKRRKKQEEEKNEVEKTTVQPKKSTRTNFTPIIFDLDQKDKMATPKVVAATLPFRHKKSALVAPIQNKLQQDLKLLVTDDATNKNIKTQIVHPVVSSDVVDNSVIPQTYSSNNSNTVLTDVNDSKSRKTATEVLLTNPVPVQESVEECVKPTAITTSEQRVRETISAANKYQIEEVKISDILKTTEVVEEKMEKDAEVITPAPIKRKCSIVESSNGEKKKSRLSFVSSEDDLLFDDDDNNFMLTSEKYDDDDADILGDIDALLA